MTNYLLTVIGTFETEQDCTQIGMSLTPIVDSRNLKFQPDKRVLLFYFASEVPKEELFDYITGALYSVSNSFILTEVSDKVSVSLPKEVKQHLFDLETPTEDINMRLEMVRIKNNLDFMDQFEEEEEDEEVMAQFWLNLKDKLKEPSLDQILDKICCDGVSSLTAFEKEILETYSKK